jgi:hypothetical protein
MGWLWFIRRTQASPFGAALVAASSASELLAPLPEEREGFGGCGGEYSRLRRPISNPNQALPSSESPAHTCCTSRAVFSSGATHHTPPADGRRLRSCVGSDAGGGGAVSVAGAPGGGGSDETENGSQASTSRAPSLSHAEQDTVADGGSQQAVQVSWFSEMSERRRGVD